MAGTRWLVLQHVEHEGPGALAKAVHAAGHDLTLVRVDQVGQVPCVDDLAGVGGLIVMGGPMGVYDEAEHPWLAAERDLMVASVDLGLPVLGICLGAQQLAVALGGSVTTGPEPEIGVGDVHLTRQAVDDPVFGPARSTLPCFHWHGDTFTLPDGSVLMAWNETYLHQAFRYGKRAYGLQFHVEVTPTLADAWRPLLPPDVEVSPEDAIRINWQGVPIAERFVALAEQQLD
jgi:GMP synthase-like glutamine amidotransferase